MACLSKKVYCLLGQFRDSVHCFLIHCQVFSHSFLFMGFSQSCPTLCDPMDCSLPGSSIHGIFQARILEWVAISFSRRSSRPRDWTQVSCNAGRCFTIWATREVQGSKGRAWTNCTCWPMNCSCCCLVTQLCRTLWDSMDCSLPGSSVHGIFHAGILEQVAISFSWGLLDPGLKPVSLASLILADTFFTAVATWEALWVWINKVPKAFIYSFTTSFPLSLSLTHTHTRAHALMLWLPQHNLHMYPVMAAYTKAKS